MLKEERLLRMSEYIKNNNIVTMNELCKTFSVSMNTVRSDIGVLVSMGRVKKLYGGVTCNTNAQYTTYNIRVQQNAEMKRKIACKAASMVVDGDIIFIDNGTTCSSIIDYLPDDISIAVITNNMAVITSAIGKSGIQLITMGGRYIPKTNSLENDLTVVNEWFQLCNISKAFVATSGITLNGNLTNSVHFEKEIKSAAIHYSQSCYLLVDSSKFGKAALFTFGKFSDMTACITDKELPDSIRGLCKNSHCNLVIAD